MEATDALEKRQVPAGSIDLENVLKLKALCDGYLGTKIRSKMQKPPRRKEEDSRKRQPRL